MYSEVMAWKIVKSNRRVYIKMIDMYVICSKENDDYDSILWSYS